MPESPLLIWDFSQGPIDQVRGQHNRAGWLGLFSRSSKVLDPKTFRAPSCFVNLQCSWTPLSLAGNLGDAESVLRGCRLPCRVLERLSMGGWIT